MEEEQWSKMPNVGEAEKWNKVKAFISLIVWDSKEEAKMGVVDRVVGSDGFRF